MRTCFIAFLACVAMAGGAAGQTGSSPGFMSVYFDASATSYQVQVPAYTANCAYVILTGPDFEQAVGYEFQFELQGSAALMSVDFRGEHETAPQIDAGLYHLDLTAPLQLESVTVLTVFTVFLLDSNPVRFTLSGVDPDPWASMDLPAIAVDYGKWQPICTASWNPASLRPDVCATINEYYADKSLEYECYGTVQIEELNWDAVKSLYR